MLIRRGHERRMGLLMSFWQREKRFLWLVALLAVAIRLAYLVLLVGPDYLPEADAADYHDIAVNLAAGQGYRLGNGALTASRPPLFPLLLAAVYALLGVNPLAGLGLQVVIGAGIVLATYALARQLFGPLAARLAALIAATYPLLVFAGGSLLTEPLFILLVTITAALAVGILKAPLRSRWVALGLSLGLTWLARPNGLWLIPFVLGWLFLAGRGTLKARLAGPVAAGLIALAVAAPWIVRNYVVFGKLIPATVMGGAVLLGSYNARVLAEPALWGAWVSPCKVPDLAWSCRLAEIPRDETQLALGIAFIRQHLDDVPRMIGWRFVRFWHLYRFEHGFPEVLGFYYYVGVAALAAVGVFVGQSRWRDKGLLVAVIACFTLSGLLFWSDFRMRAPIEPALVVLAAAALGRVGQPIGLVRARSKPI